MTDEELRHIHQRIDDRVRDLAGSEMRTILDGVLTSQLGHVQTALQRLLEYDQASAKEIIELQTNLKHAVADMERNRYKIEGLAQQLADLTAQKALDSDGNTQAVPSVPRWAPANTIEALRYIAAVVALLSILLVFGPGAADLLGGVLGGLTGD